MKSFSIKNYKNLKDFKIDSLGRINLIVGKNNVGKSTLLEAISLFAAAGDVTWLKQILEMRGVYTRFPSDTENTLQKEIDAFASIYIDRDINAFYSAPIQIKADNQTGLFDEDIVIGFKLVKVVDLFEKNDAGIQIRTRKVLENDEEILFDDSNITIGIASFVNDHRTVYSFNNRMLGRSAVNKLLPFEYVRTSQITSDKNPGLFDRITLSPLQDYLIKALHIIEPRIEDINFLKDDSARGYSRDDNRVPYVVFKGSSERYRLTSMGDGVNRILTIILALLNCKEGILLIDEFDNGLHYSVQTQLWQMINKLARELNVQVFATTHSEDCIKSFIEADDVADGKLIRLENRNGNIISVEYHEKDELDFISSSKIEVR